jgi:multidrug resistance efflux pump
MESSVDGTKIFVEAPFSEIDAAWELINHQINSTRQESNTSAKQVAPAGEKLDLAGEIAKLASLHQSGILSDEEFAAAKTAVIGATGR